MKTSSQIIGFGHSVPSQRIYNCTIERKLNIKSGIIEQKTGIKSRYWAGKDETLTDIATQAGEMALNDASINKDDIALTLLATSTPDHLLPPSSPIITHRLGLSNSGSIDLTGACSGFLYALVLADSYLNLHNKPILIIAANLLSRRINMEDHDTAIIFGDAAGAVVLAPSQSEYKRGIIGIKLISDGSKYNLIKIPSGGSICPTGKYNSPNDFFIHFSNGKEIFYSAVSIMTKSAQQALRMAHLEPKDIDRFIPHQANIRIINKVCEQIGFSKDIVVTSLSDFGNSSAATIPLSLSLENERKPFQSGEKILLSAVGAGMTGGSLVFMI
ncbi:MAG: 3-oxoacyl-ACP synthase [Candidatus Liberibacter europaeus]|uniref:3-oxopimeloyl-[acyl-carrier-protein] synthase n=1 Tax=Candidatus Liberibacter europaeus TaxID=744859 RepID=A0A2T4VYX4_9HYPH|nr:beta-ketoacyl-ACP synthase III [Candidatus Liberibacter europaeus]PTL86984.1 MAG: 3-oxoacyl-ACP synthase [Candidatus Liberibacter europaeus]